MCMILNKYNAVYLALLRKYLFKIQKFKNDMISCAVVIKYTFGTTWELWGGELVAGSISPVVGELGEVL